MARKLSLALPRIVAPRRRGGGSVRQLPAVTQGVATSGGSSVLGTYHSPLSVRRCDTLEQDLRRKGAHFGYNINPMSFTSAVSPDVSLEPIPVGLEAAKVQGDFGFLVVSRSV